MTLGRYLEAIPHDPLGANQNGGIDAGQVAWYKRLKEQVAIGQGLYERALPSERSWYHELFKHWIRTEELKAWYGSPEGGSLFQGTSISSLTVPYMCKDPLQLSDVSQLEEAIADAYIQLHDRHVAQVRNAISENVDEWISDGLYYGVVVASKVISQAFGLSAPTKDLIFDVDGTVVDPHEILTCTDGVREKYFKICREKVTCFQDFDVTQAEFEESLILADISKPKISRLADHLILGPVRCNEIAAILARHISQIVRSKTKNRINPPSLNVTIYDTDTPYTYYQMTGSLGNPMAPILPGLVTLGTSGTIDAFRWLYAYRISLVSQKMMHGSVYSQVKSEFMPFVFFGVLVHRDAEILLDMKNLDTLRYRGNLNPAIEFSYLVGKLADTLSENTIQPLIEELERRLR